MKRTAHSNEGERLGNYRRRKKTRRHGSLVQTQDVVGSIGGGVLSGAVTQALILAVSVLAPQLGAALFAGYLIYRFGNEALRVKRDYDEAEGTPEDKAVTAAVKEGVRVGVGLILQKEVGDKVDALAQRTAVATTDALAKHGTFNHVVGGIGLPSSASEDLRDFYYSAFRRILVGAYQGAQDEISDYVSRRVM